MVAARAQLPFTAVLRKGSGRAHTPCCWPGHSLAPQYALPLGDQPQETSPPYHSMGQWEAVNRRGQVPAMTAHCESVSSLCTSRGKHGEVGSPKLSVLGGGVFESRWVEIT